jgi:hypothetical protein
MPEQSSMADIYDTIRQIQIWINGANFARTPGMFE